MKRYGQYAAIAFVILFWMLTPLIAQKYFNYSAINISFIITVFYFVIWKIYNNRQTILQKL
ncbi:hypothetical protein [Candidatus Nanohalobium constans]|uniref:Uncharacterized protein n=1 Tax=Candidatus Nanohalobium constans TaxID=2565781 RepID=A0A5Q0UFI8_9ARCH|nr:hypothetical protein [Candidatus Nanohalobium constans]QGA80346.1 hypothetical protein LC1Nh_0445 [Candidatus Nanohalobium constans]